MRNDISRSRSVCACLVAQSYLAPLSMGFYRQEVWSELPFPALGDLPDPGMRLMSFESPAWANGFFTTCAAWEAKEKTYLKFWKEKRERCSKISCMGNQLQKGIFFLIDMIALQYEPLYIFKIMFCFFKVMIFFILISSIYLKSSGWLTNGQPTVDIVIFLNFMTLIGKKVGNYKAKIL